jgi:hypothetical protein
LLLHVRAHSKECMAFPALDTLRLSHVYPRSLHINHDSDDSWPHGCALPEISVCSLSWLCALFGTCQGCTALLTMTKRTLSHRCSWCTTCNNRSLLTKHRKRDVRHNLCSASMPGRRPLMAMRVSSRDGPGGIFSPRVWSQYVNRRERPLQLVA